MAPKDAEQAVYTAIRDGYRLIDTANGYLNEEAVGRAIHRAIEEGIVKREDLFVSTKIWPTMYQDPDAVDGTLKRLGLDYIDLLFIHQPAGAFLDGYKLIEKAYKEGKARSLGISNMYGEKLDTLLKTAEIKPHVGQYELHPYFTEADLRKKLNANGTHMMGWYPLGHGDKGLFEEPVFQKLSETYHKSVPQIILRWAVQMDFITIPGSVNPDHIRSNFDIFDFELTDEDMKEIAKLDGTKRYYTPNKTLEESYASMKLGYEK
jgi:diketogulonate reductase-like aldo/keto reductase